MWANKLIDRLTDTHAYRQTNRQTYGQTERRTETQTDNGQTDRLQTDTQTHMQLNRRTDGQTDRRRQTERKMDWRQPEEWQSFGERDMRILQT